MNRSTTTGSAESSPAAVLVAVLVGLPVSAGVVLAAPVASAAPLTAAAVTSLPSRYLADSNGNRVVEVAPDGTRSTVGSGLNRPTGVALDETGTTPTTSG